MRILWVKVGGLWPVNTGGRLRSFHVISELASRHEVTIATTHLPGDDPDALAAHVPPSARVVSIPHAIPKFGTARFGAALVESWLSPLPVDLLKFRVPALARDVKRRLDSGGADVCVADFLSATVNVPTPAPVPVVFFAHNVEYMIWKRLCENETRRARRRLLEVEWRKMRRAEARACTRSAATIAVSEADRTLLAADAPGAILHAIPTGVDTAYFAPDSTRDVPDTLVFSGSMDWYPNEDAVLHFLEDVFPRIAERVPRVSFTIVGRNPTARVRAAAAARSGVFVTGTVDDVRPHLAGAAVYVVPLRVGGGTRLKIFEALAMGKAVVSTTVGAEGLPLVSGHHIVREDEPSAFADAVVELLGDPERRRALGNAGRTLVETCYSWSQVAREFEVRCTQTLACTSGDRQREGVSHALCRAGSSPAGVRFER
jgi:glycosyltransferase involved in cell wall biosynthesis